MAKHKPKPRGYTSIEGHSERRTWVSSGLDDEDLLPVELADGMAKAEFGSVMMKIFTGLPPACWA